MSNGITQGQVSGFNFVQVASEAKKLPEAPPSHSGGKAIALPPVFETTEEADEREQKYIEKEVDPSKVGLETHFKGYSKVFVLYRPWEKCPRCQRAIADAEDKAKEDDSVKPLLPLDEGDYTCPHTHAKEYARVIDRSLRGDILLTMRDNFMTPDGVRRIQVEWLEADPDKQRELERKAKLKKEQQVYPPDPEAAFAKGKPEPK